MCIRDRFTTAQQFSPPSSFTTSEETNSTTYDIFINYDSISSESQRWTSVTSTTPTASTSALTSKTRFKRAISIWGKILLYCFCLNTAKILDKDYWLCRNMFSKSAESFTGFLLDILDFISFVRHFFVLLVVRVECYKI